MTRFGSILVVVLMLLIALPGRIARAQDRLQPSKAPENRAGIPDTERSEPGRTSWRYKASPKLRKVRHEPTNAGAFPLRQKQWLLGFELGWPFYEVQVGVGLHDRVQLDVGMRGMWLWTVGAYAGLKIGLLRNRERSTALSVRAIGGYRHLVGDEDQTFRQLGGGDKGFGELWLLGSVRMGTRTLHINGGVRVSQVSECTKWDEQEPDCAPDPFDNGGSGLLVTGFLELGVSVRIDANFSYFTALGLDVFVVGQQEWPAMIRFKMGLVVNP